MGRGINLQIEVTDVAAIAGRLQTAGVALYRPLTDAVYTPDDRVHQLRQFLVQDPDGYLLRFCESVLT